MKSILSIFLFLLALIVQGQSNDSIKASPQDLIGQKMPELIETSIDGEAWNSDTLKGKVVVVNFWFIGCMPCMKEVKYLNSLKEKYKDDNLALLSIAPHVKQDLRDFNSDSINRFSRIRKALAKTKIEYEIISECSERTRTIGNNTGPDCDRISSMFNVKGYPTTFIINQEGIIEYTKVGYGLKSSALKENLEYRPGFENIIDKILAKADSHNKQEQR